MVVDKSSYIQQILKEEYNKIKNISPYPPRIINKLNYPIEERKKEISIILETPYKLKAVYEKNKETEAVIFLAQFLQKYNIDPSQRHLEWKLKSKGDIYTLTIESVPPQHPYQKDPFLYGKYFIWEGEAYLLNEKGERISDMLKECSIRCVRKNENLLKEYPLIEGKEGKDLWGNSIKPQEIDVWKILTNKHVVKKDEKNYALYISSIEGVAVYKRDPITKKIILIVSDGLEINKLSYLHLNGNGKNKILELPTLKYLRIKETDKEVYLIAPSAIVEVDELQSVKLISSREIIVSKAHRYSYKEKGKSRLPLKAKKVKIKKEMHYCNVECEKYVGRGKEETYITNTEIKTKEIELERSVLGNVVIKPLQQNTKTLLSFQNIEIRETGIEIYNPVIKNIRNIKGIENVKITIEAKGSLPYSYEEFKTLKPFIERDAQIIIKTQSNKEVKLTQQIYNKILDALKEKQNSQKPSK